MSETGLKTKKIYYSMGEVSEMFDVNASLIRFWEQKFTILKPEKNKKGNRLFTRQDVDNLKLIYHLVKENGMTLSGAQKRLKENREGVERNLEIIERLQGIKAMLLEVRQQLKGAGGDAVEIIVEEDTTPVEAPFSVTTNAPPVCQPDVSGDFSAEMQTVAPLFESVGSEPVEDVSPLWPREQPLFPEYVTPVEAQPVPPALARPSESDFEPEPLPKEEEKAPAPKMQVIEQTLF